MSLKKVRGGVTGFGDTLVSKTCRFFRVSRKGQRGGGGGHYIWYSTVYVLHAETVSGNTERQCDLSAGLL